MKNRSYTIGGMRWAVGVGEEGMEEEGGGGGGC